MSSVWSNIIKGTTTPSVERERNSHRQMSEMDKDADDDKDNDADDDESKDFFCALRFPPFYITSSNFVWRANMKYKFGLLKYDQ